MNLDYCTHPTCFLGFLVHVMSTALTGSHHRSQLLLTDCSSPPTPPRWTEILSPVSWGCSCQVFCQWQERKKKRNTSINSFTRWKFCFSCLAYAFLIKPGNPTFLSSLRRNRTGSVGLNTAINASVPLTSFSSWGYFERKTLWVHKRLLGFQAQS